MTSKPKRSKTSRRAAVSFEIDDLFGPDHPEDAVIPAEKFGGAVPSDRSKILDRRGEEKVHRKPRRATVRSKVSVELAPRWQPGRNFSVFGNGDGPEHSRVRRKKPSPEIFDETLFRLLSVLPLVRRKKVLCEGSVFPAVAAAAAGAEGHLFLGEGVEGITADAAGKLVPGCTSLSGGVGGEFDLVVLCHDDLAGEKAAETVVGKFSEMCDTGIMVACFPAETFLDYSTNIRMEAPNMRNRVHRLCRTHFILRATGPLMQPSWDILVLSRRGGQADVPACRWRFTGNGVLPWQKCNEAFSGAPWLLVESDDQIGPAVARCVSYPWEPFPAVR